METKLFEIIIKVECNDETARCLGNLLAVGGFLDVMDLLRCNWELSSREMRDLRVATVTLSDSDEGGVDVTASGIPQ